MKLIASCQLLRLHRQKHRLRPSQSSQEVYLEMAERTGQTVREETGFRALYAHMRCWRQEKRGVLVSPHGISHDE